MRKAFILALLYASHLCAQSPVAPDLWQTLRSSFKLPSADKNIYVQQQIRWIQNHPGYLQEFAQQSGPFIYHVLEEVKHRNLPGELALIPMVESNYDPHAYSRVGAAGLWQLMPQTGSGLGVVQNQWFDGRRDIAISTKAALNYMEYLNRFFGGQWLPAFAAYDSGEGTVQRAYNRIGNKANFWSLPLPTETQRYVPRILALAAVIRSPERYHVRLPAKTYHAYFTQVNIDKPINLHQAAEFAGISYKCLLQINPAHNQWTTSPGQSSALFLPTASATAFRKAYATYQTRGDAYRVKSGDVLSKIAIDHQTTVATVMQLNSMRSSVIKTGQTLAMPSPYLLTKANKVDVKRQSAIAKGQQRGPTQIIHHVGKEDTLTKVSQHYHIKSSQLVFWNQLKSTQLKPNQTLTIWLNARDAVAITNATYRVKDGDTLSGIAHRHHLTLNRLVALNPQLKNTKYIRSRQMLVVRT